MLPPSVASRQLPRKRGSRKTLVSSPACGGGVERSETEGAIGRRLRKLAAASLLALLAACGQKGDDKAGPAEAPPAAAEKGPAMWAVSDADSTIYLFGTFHILPPDLKWKTKAFDAAMTATPATFVEVDTKDPAAQARMAALVEELGLNPPGVTLTALLGPVRAVRFSAVAEHYGLSMAMFDRMKPWLAMITLSVSIMQKEGFSAENGVEEAVLSRAAGEGDELGYLESAEYQIRALASLDENEILADFDASLEDYEDFDGYAKRVINAWFTGDIKALEDETLAEMRKKAPESFRILIKDRNANWVKEIKTMMEGEKDYFIAVGAGHLVGEGSVVDMLEKDGVTVKRIQ